jgi:hypothetical protein
MSSKDSALGAHSIVRLCGVLFVDSLARATFGVISYRNLVLISMVLPDAPISSPVTVLQSPLAG